MIVSEEEKAIYHNPYTCNKCGEANWVFGDLREGEAWTECKYCAFSDHWSYGFFDSGEEMESNCKKYNSKSCPF